MHIQINIRFIRLKFIVRPKYKCRTISRVFVYSNFQTYARQTLVKTADCASKVGTLFAANAAKVSKEDTAR